MKIVIIIPTWNERENIGPLIEELQGEFLKISHDMHILIVDDSSPDGTADVVRGLQHSTHSYENTLNVLRTYNSLVSKGSCFIVEDSNINHDLVFPNEFRSGGPYEAIEEFVNENDDFIVDRTRERFVITWNPKGYLKKIK